MANGKPELDEGFQEIPVAELDEGFEEIPLKKKDTLSGNGVPESSEPPPIGVTSVSLDRQLPYLKEQAAKSFSERPDIFSNRNARQAYYDRLSAPYKGRDYFKVRAAIMEVDPYAKQEAQQAAVSAMNPIGETIPTAIEAAATGIQRGIEKGAKTKEVMMKEGIPSGMLNAAVATGETLLGAAGAIVPELAAFNVASKGLEEKAPEAAKWMSPAHKGMKAIYGENMPKWAENTAAVADFVANLAVFGGAALVGKKLSPAEIIKQSTPENIKKAEERTNEKFVPHPDEVKAETIQGDIDKNPESPLNPVLQQEADGLRKKVADERLAKAQSEAETTHLNDTKAELEKQIEPLSEESKKVVQPILDEVNGKIKTMADELKVGDKNLTLEEENQLKELHKKSFLKQEMTPQEQQRFIELKNKKTEIKRKQELENQLRPADHRFNQWDFDVKESEATTLGYKGENYEVTINIKPKDGKHILTIKKRNPNTDLFSETVHQSEHTSLADAVKEYEKHNSEIKNEINARHDEKIESVSKQENIPVEEKLPEGVKDFTESITANDKAVAEGMEFSSPAEYDRYVSENSENPLELAHAYLNIGEYKNQKSYLEEMLEEHPIKITAEDFGQYGDLNNVSPVIAKKWFDKNASPLDTQLQELSEVIGVEVTPQTFIDHILETETRQPSKYASLRTKLKNRFYELTGQDLTPKLAKKIIEEHEKTGTVHLPSAKVREGVKRETLQDVGGETQTAKDAGGKAEPQEITPSPSEILKEEGLPEKPTTGITHEQTNVAAKELGLEEYESTPETFAKWDRQADERLRNNPHTIPDLIGRLERGERTDAVDQRVMLRYMSSLEAKIRENPSDELIAEYDKAKKLNDVEGTKTGRELASRKGAVPVEDSLAELLVAKKESAGVDKLTEAQKASVTEMFNEYQKAKAEAEAKIAKLEEANAKLRADQEFIKQRQSVRKGRKTHEEHVAYREKIVKDISAKLKEIRSEGQATIIPYARELAAITPDVLKLMKDHIEEGVGKLEDIVKNIHGQIKEHIPDVKESDVRDIIAGKYTEPKKTRNELAASLSKLKSEAILINKLEALERGEIPTNEVKKVKRNQEIKELRDKIKAEGITQLQEIKKRNEQSVKRIEERIKNKEYTTVKKVSALDNPELRKKHPELFKEALESLVKKEDAKHALEVDRYKDEMARRSKLDKAIDLGKALIATSRAIVSGIDDSIVGVQTGLAMMANPRSGAKAFKEHILDAVSEKRFKQEIQRVHHSDYWHLMEQSGLDQVDPVSLRREKHEEVFDKNLLNKDFEYKGKKFNVGKYSTRPFERAFTSLGNHFRENLFIRQADALMMEGKTFKTHPQDFKGIAQVANTMTGRGKPPKAIEMSSDLISPIVWSPKLISSGLNILGLSDVGRPLGLSNGYYTKLSPAARKYAISQTVKGIGVGVGLMMAAKYGGAEVDDDPTSVTFGSVKFSKDGNSYNIFGRFTPFVRLIAMQLTGKRTTERGTEVLGERYGGHTIGGEYLKFARGKVTPAAGVIIDAITGKKYDNTDFSIPDAGKDLLTPLAIKDIEKGLEQDGTKSLLTRGIPSFFGLKVSNKKDFEKAYQEKSTDTGKIKVDKEKVEKVNVEKP